MWSRRETLALMAALAATSGGCAASRTGHQSLPPQVAERAAPSPVIATIVEKSNRNAELVQTLKAMPSVSARTSRIGAGARGNLIFERDHNFRFIVESGYSGKHEADIGSNDDEFWFWANDKKDHNVYVCRYDTASAPGGAELAFQPDWIIEALGLRVIPEAEQRQIQIVSNGQKPGTVAWNHTRRTLRGETEKKVTILDQNGTILEHRFYTPESKYPVAIASPAGTIEVPLSDDANRKVRLPKKIHLKLAASDPKQPPIEMDLVLGSDVKVNAPVTEEMRAELFTVPNDPHNPITRLDDNSSRGRVPAGGSAWNRTETRRSIAPPAAGRSIELGEPSPIGTDGAYLRRTDPMPLSPDLGGAAQEGPEAQVGAPNTQPPETAAERISRAEASSNPR